MNDRFAIGIDIGGTFTDCSVIEDGSGTITVTKSLSTPHKPSEGFFNVLDEIAGKIGLPTRTLLERTGRLVHGTTRGTNALVARHGAQVGLIATTGHADVVKIMKGGGRTRGLSPDSMLHVAKTGKPETLVSVERCAEVAERIDRKGNILLPISKESVTTAARTLIENGAEAIAISFLWSVRNPVHEQKARDWIREIAPDIFVSCAHELVSSVGEFSRTMTAIMNAYVGPLMVKYVTDIEEGLRERGYVGKLLFTQCAGGAITGDEVRRAPIQTLQSGPVSGILASAFLGSQIGTPNILTADMGGTTLDVGIIHNLQPLTRIKSVFERFELALPMLDLDSVGAGGGSIAWLDEVGRLQVGPRSAGANPGPVCFRRGGTEPTVTDADVVLGIIDPASFLHGGMTLDKAAAEAAIARIAEPLGLSVHQTAAGINRIVDAKMGDLIRRMSLLRGYDPRQFTCYAFGGAGPPHAGAMAREAGVPSVIIPLLNVSTVWSAFGAASSDIVHVLQTPRRLRLPVSPEDVWKEKESLIGRAHAAFAEQGLDPERMDVRFSIRMKYVMQVHDVSVDATDLAQNPDLSEILAAKFSAAYEQQYGVGAGYAEGGVEISSFELRVTSAVPKPNLPRVRCSETDLTMGSRDVYWDETGSVQATPVLHVGTELPSALLVGPILIDLPDTVAVVRPGQTARFDEYGNLILRTNAHAQSAASLGMEEVTS